MGLTEDLAYPFREKGWHWTFAIGMVLEYFTWLVVPALLLAGYYVRVMRDVAAGHEEPPEFHSYGELLADGTKAVGILLAYLLVPIAVSWVFTVPAVLALVNGEPGAFSAFFTGMVVSGGLVILFAYGGVAGLVKFARTGRMRSAFSPSLLGVVASVAWLRAWVKVHATGFVALGTSVIIALIPLVNLTHIVLIPLQIKYFFTVYSRIFARAYGRAAGTPVADAETTTSDAATTSDSGGTGAVSTAATPERPAEDSDDPSDRPTPGAVSTRSTWSPERSLAVRNETGVVQQVTVGCRPTAGDGWTDVERLEAGAVARFEDLPDGRFHVDVIADENRQLTEEVTDIHGTLDVAVTPEDVLVRSTDEGAGDRPAPVSAPPADTDSRQRPRAHSRTQTGQPPGSATLGLFIGAVLVSVTLSFVSEFVLTGPSSGLLDVLLSMVGIGMLVIGLVADARHVSGRTEWTPRLRYYVPGVVLAWIITVPVYLYRRHKVSNRYDE
jgi:hypothetical protein